MESPANLFSRRRAGADGQNLVDDFRTFVDDLETWLKTARSSSGDTMSAARSRLDDTLAHARTRLDDARSLAAERAGYAVETANDYVRREPLKALGIAAAVGAIVVLLISASRSSREM